MHLCASICAVVAPEDMVDDATAAAVAGIVQDLGLRFDGRDSIDVVLESLEELGVSTLRDVHYIESGDLEHGLTIKEDSALKLHAILAADMGNMINEERQNSWYEVERTHPPTGVVIDDSALQLIANVLSQTSSSERYLGKRNDDLSHGDEAVQPSSLKVRHMKRRYAEKRGCERL